MKKALISILLAGMLILYGCPAQTEESIDNGSYVALAWFSGTWKEVKAVGKGDMYIIEPVKDKKGNFSAYKLDSLGRKSELDKIPVILSDVGGEIFLNAYGLGGEMNQEGWFLFKLKKESSKEFSILPVKEYEIEFSSTQEEVKAFIQKNKDNIAIFDETQLAHYKKVK